MGKGEGWKTKPRAEIDPDIIRSLGNLARSLQRDEGAEPDNDTYADILSVMAQYALNSDSLLALMEKHLPVKWADSATRERWIIAIERAGKIETDLTAYLYAKAAREGLVIAWLEDNTSTSRQ